MNEAQIHRGLVLMILGCAALTYLLLSRITAPYGRFSRAGWGPAMPARVAWTVFESPAVLVFAAVYAAGDHAVRPVPLALLALWQWHYLDRAFGYPLRMRTTGKRVPVAIVLLALVFNTVNAYVNARWISELGDYPAAWLRSPPFAVGTALFAAGWFINRFADRTLHRLRSAGQTGYRIPRGGLYRYLSCPNYFGEVLMWTGWATATWSLAGTAFAVFTAANLVPRAVATHRWYRRNLDDYPTDRRALIPGVF